MTKQPALPDVCAATLEQLLKPELFKALCDPVRISIVATMAAEPEPATVSGIAEQCDIDFSGVSRHLKILKDAGIVEASKRGREMRYTLNNEQLANTLHALADALIGC